FGHRRKPDCRSGSASGYRNDDRHVARGCRCLHIEQRLKRAVELDVATLEVELASENRQAPPLHCETADCHRLGRGSGQPQIAAKLGIEPAAAHEDPVGSCDVNVECNAHVSGSLAIGTRRFALTDVVRRVHMLQVEFGDRAWQLVGHRYIETPDVDGSAGTEIRWCTAHVYGAVHFTAHEL